uniref:Cadherin domain-containing protein n=1 Tax=Junco hyemalis TaxID=40217 RepID=A0A8C5JTW1_JUNHY
LQPVPPLTLSLLNLTIYILEVRHWAFSEDSGVLQLKKSLVNSGIKNSNFGLKITATDGENFADAMFVNISVVHGKVSSKTFSCRETRVAQKLAEKLLKKAKANVKLNLEDGFLDFYSVNRQIIQVEARDKDLGPNGEVTYSVLTDTHQFAINSSTGVVYVSDQLDREAKANYTLKIEARDRAESGHQQFSVVPLKVFLDDVNDCSPAFIPSSYNVKVLEDLPVGTVIAWLETHDPDLVWGSWCQCCNIDTEISAFDIY